jgi:RNA polymerase sigma factor (sigma-70 family)
MDDASLLARYARERDAEAFAEITRRHAGLVYGTCLRVLGDQVRAEDAAQEAFLALARHAGAIRQSLVAWLHRVALHAALRQRRRERTALAVELGDLPAPVREAWRAMLPQLDAALERLPEHLREVIARRYLQGQVQEEIAVELGISQATVSRRLEDGVRRLRNALAAGLDEGAMGSALALAVVPPPAPLIAACGKIAIAGAGVLSAPVAAGGVATFGAHAVAAALAILVLGAVAIGLVGVREAGRAQAPTMAPAPAPAPRDPAAAPHATDARDRLVTIHVTGMSVADAVACLDVQLRHDLGERLVLVNGFFADSALVSLDCERRPLREALAAVEHQASMRERVHRGMVVIDVESGCRIPEVLQRPGLSKAAVDNLVGYQVGVGDLDNDGELLALFADPAWERLFRSDSRLLEGMQEAVCDALARVGATWQQWRPEGGALRALADSPRACAGLRAMWRLARERHQHVLPFQIYLAAALGCGDLAPDLREIAVHPMSARPGLLPAGLVPDLACSAERTSAIRALGWLPEPASAELIRSILRAAPDDAARAALIESMGELGDAADADLVMPRPEDDQVTVAACVLALARLDPGRLAPLLGAPAMALRARLASLALPRLEFVPVALAGAEAPDYQSRWVAWRGTALLDAATLQAGRMLLDERQDPTPMRLAIAARAGDDGALDALVDRVARDGRALAEQVVHGDDDPALELIATLDAARQDRALTRLRAGLNLAHAGDGALAMLRARTSDALVRELTLAWPRADGTARAAIARALARCQIPAGSDAIARLLRGADALEVAHALGPSDLHGCRLRIVIGQAANIHLGEPDAGVSRANPEDTALGMALASCGVLEHPEGAATFDRLRAHLREVTPEVFSRLTARAEAPPLWRDATPTDLAWTLIGTQDRPDQQPLRRACGDFLERTTTRDCGQMCLLLPDRGATASDRDPACMVTIDLSSWERAHPLSDFERSTRDLIDESAILSGSLDAAERLHSTIIFHPELARQALATPAPAAPPAQRAAPPTHDF